MAATHYFSLYALDIIHHHCCVSGLYYTRLSFRWYGDFGPIPHVVLSLSVAQGGLTLCISLVSISVRGLVPLHNACSYGHYEVAELLVKVIHLRECFTGSWCMKDLPVVWNVIHLFTPPPPPSNRRPGLPLVGGGGAKRQMTFQTSKTYLIWHHDEFIIQV